MLTLFCLVSIFTTTASMSSHTISLMKPNGITVCIWTFASPISVAARFLEPSTGSGTEGKYWQRQPTLRGTHLDEARQNGSTHSHGKDT